MNLDPNQYPDESSDDDLSSDADDQSYDEYLAALGRPIPRWAVPVGIGVAVLALAMLIYYQGGNVVSELVRRSGGDETAIEDTTRQGVPHALPDSELLTAAGGDTTTVLASARLVSPQSVMLVTDSLSDDFEYEETLFNLLNATVSPYETAALQDTAFYNLLFTPLIESDKRITLFRERRADLRRELAGGVSAIDTVGVSGARDSLNTMIAEYKELIADVRRDSLTYARQSARLAVAVDSVRQTELKKLSKILDTMNPASAATMLAGRSSAELEDILFRVKPRVAAKILQNMSAAKRGGLAASIVRR